MHYQQFKLEHPPLPGTVDPTRLQAYQELLSKACASSDSSALNRGDCLILTLLNKVSLNNIRVVASGIMTIDTSKVPSTLTSIQFASDPAAASSWAGPAAAAGSPRRRRPCAHSHRQGWESSEHAAAYFVDR
jgi:hypothetical protein